MLGKRTLAAVVALMLILGMGATTLLSFLPTGNSQAPTITADLGPTIERAWAGDPAASGALPAAVAQSVDAGRDFFAGEGLTVDSASVSVRPLANEIWEVHTTVELSDGQGRTQTAWPEYFRLVDGVVVPVPPDEVQA
ncbi:hypothetical protein [Tessaracoccus flavus]|uniref:Uncharacterized protein n=1 Tax=Tessaracoccus flavus TaxID=1610493 RepID=A0A1Q2CFY6_9ACTN|nr:hypothetical protein [Tessaracoccus flavus]AQP45028.1 hypothetical protein RPIT_09715 [Tessaracoccus flavus]SDY58736.1 hypothetical protein SAMN05428934_102362 [Tessaracoccus flavus]